MTRGFFRGPRCSLFSPGKASRPDQLERLQILRIVRQILIESNLFFFWTKFPLKFLYVFAINLGGKIPSRRPESVSGGHVNMLDSSPDEEEYYCLYLSSLQFVFLDIIHEKSAMIMSSSSHHHLTTAWPEKFHGNAFTDCDTEEILGTPDPTDRMDENNPETHFYRLYQYSNEECFIKTIFTLWIWVFTSVNSVILLFCYFYMITSRL